MTKASELQDHGVYWLKENQFMEFGVYNADTKTFIGLDKMDDELVEAELCSPEEQLWGDVFPQEFLGISIPSYVAATKSVLRTTVWEDNADLKQWLWEIRGENEGEWKRRFFL